MSAPFGLDDERAFVTVANAGIGRAIALGLAAAEARVIPAGRAMSRMRF